MRHHQDSWDFAIDHALGVDRADHRISPDHPVLREKLEQMNILLRDIAAAMDDDTLLIMFGDRGMDKMSNSGGGSILETMSALWIYSKAHFPNSKCYSTDYHISRRYGPPSPCPTDRPGANHLLTPRSSHPIQYPWNHHSRTF
ncbi:hypothetical protein BDR03DRAFT_973682 [Suillus americanus]|nr:hypothetical protein BDR03DRAFT_973682 [Suillus americanus]